MALKKRVCLLAPFPPHQLPGHGDGVARHHATWLPPLVPYFEEQSEFDLHWITFTKQVKVPTTVSFRRQTFHLLPRQRLSLQILSGFRHECEVMLSLIRKLAPGLVHGWGAEEGYGLAAVRMERHVISMQGILNAYCRASRPHPLLRVQAAHERRLLASARFVTVESEWGRRQLLPMAPGAEIRIVEYGLDSGISALERKVSAANTVLFVGTLNKLKGVDVLLDAFSDPRLAGFRLVLLGDGPLRTGCRNPNNNCEFMGHLPSADVREWMARTPFLIHPTRGDTSPNCVKEARVLGVPVATTPDGGQTAYVEDGISGVIFPSGDKEALIRAVLRMETLLHANPGFGTHGMEDCRAKLNAAATAGAILDIYRTLIP